MANPRLALLWIVTAAACGAPAEWQRAQALWDRKDPRAHAAWLAIPPDSAEGHEAATRLQAAEAEYRRGIDLLRSGLPGSRDALLAGTRLAPMDPRLYLPLARASRERQLPERAAEFYGKYLALVPGAPDAMTARAELQTLSLGDDEVVDPAAAPPPSTAWVWPLVASGLALVALFAWATAAVMGRRGRSLAELARSSPELHPAIAYLVGCMRHELIKHRISAVADAARALAGGGGAPGLRAFLLARLYGGEPLRLAWAGHLSSFMRALGPRFDLQRGDAAFRDAGRAIGDIAALELAFARGDGDAAVRLERAFERLRRFDATLAALVSGLVRTTVDTELLETVVAAVRSEYAAGQVPLDEVTVTPVPPAVAVDVYRIDLELMLRNLVRNAISAVGRGPAPRRIALDVRVDLEPTGEETVRLRVRDTSGETIAPALVRGLGTERGLGLVTSALDRYDGCLELEQATGGYAKGVTLRLFRSLDVDPAAEAAA